jgi:hypothetical protein
VGVHDVRTFRGRAADHTVGSESGARGGVSERLKETVLKTVEAQASVGSNPTPSAIIALVRSVTTRRAIEAAHYSGGAISTISPRGMPSSMVSHATLQGTRKLG